MRIKTSIKVGINQYKEISHKKVIALIGLENFKNSKNEFIELYKAGNPNYIDYKVFYSGAVVYFERG